MLTLDTLTPPKEGQRIEIKDGKMLVPDTPIIPFIEGDGTGPDIWRASVRVLDAAVERAYGEEAPDRVVRDVRRREIVQGFTGAGCPRTRCEAVSRATSSGIKGPLTTPVGGGIRSA